ncbi:MAG: hypothetical protein F4Y38_13440 [Gemmatimonadetes bacterium]|nr:hypothetical protein [Gemmatimonadota bacterium]MYG85818.1 hypothetical protein [Gemmatimonadota bacterium]MYJ89766.1 hypothetical protein [Gemmatimonadota bacterium]
MTAQESRTAELGRERTGWDDETRFRISTPAEKDTTHKDKMGRFRVKDVEIAGARTGGARTGGARMGGNR